MVFRETKSHLKKSMLKRFFMIMVMGMIVIRYLVGLRKTRIVKIDSIGTIPARIVMVLITNFII